MGTVGTDPFMDCNDTEFSLKNIIETVTLIYDIHKGRSYKIYMKHVNVKHVHILKNKWKLHFFRR